MNEPVEFLRLENVSKRFGGIVALSNVDLTIYQGEVVVLLGENGSGKSTMIKIIAGVYNPDSGTIHIGQKQYKVLNPILSIREHIQVIYQDLSLFPNLTVAENISIGHFIAHRRNVISWQEIYKIAQQTLSKIGTDIPLDVKLATLPVADWQIVAIGRALIEDAQLIIMDESTSALTQKEIQRLFQIIKNLKQQNISFLFVTHKLEEVKEIADRVVILRDSKKVLEQNAQGLDIKTMEFYMTGRIIDENATTRHNFAEVSATPLLHAGNLTLLPYFSEITFDLMPREILGITGLVGSGRTEIALSLFGVLPATSGEIYINGRKINVKNIKDAIRSGIGYIPENRIREGLFLTQSVGRNIVARIIRSLTKRGVLLPYIINQTAQTWIKELDIKTPSSEIPVSSLSGGNQQRVLIAKWLASNPKILILNLPTVGIDVGSKASIHDLMRKLAQNGIGIILISDDIPEILHVCDRILVMEKGRIKREIHQGEVDEDKLYQIVVG